MVERLRMTATVTRVLSCFLSDAEADRYGLDLMRDSGLPSGTLYPILNRLNRAGWVEASWEQIDPEVEGRPARRYYRLTPDGAVAAQRELAAVQAQLSRALRPTTKPETA